MAIHLTRAFQSRVARRVTLLFFACAMIPLAGLAIVTSISVQEELDAQAQVQLAEDVKNSAMWGLGQLDLTEGRLRLIGVAFASGGSKAMLAARVDQVFHAAPKWLALFKGGRLSTTVRGPETPLALGAAQREYLTHSGRVIAEVLLPDGPHPVLVITLSNDPETMAAATIDVRDMFGLDAVDEVLPPQSALCVAAAGRVLGCSPDAPPDLGEAARAGGAPATPLRGDDGELMTKVRPLPLTSLYGATDWILAMARPQSLARAPVRAFLRNSWAIALLTGLIVSWISVWQIRRQLRPLDELTAATSRLANRQFDQPVALASHDEFEDLGNAFNDLAERLRRQFDELEAFNLGTLATLARAIDAKSPWTAGHSERVTAMSVKIATEMGLPENEISELARGGLVHDIGKLATPPGILDKPGRLTPEEFAIMQEHPAKGVHILEPLPAFRPLLPIVGQHHERWDGAGYPAGLAGTAIARTARVLAVADVFDAVASDRPYRPGMPHAQAVELIRQGSGTHFDPEVVAAFLRIIGREAAPAAPPIALAS